MSAGDKFPNDDDIGQEEVPSTKNTLVVCHILDVK
jgi:hypothetical protein